MGECMNLNLIPHLPTVGENMNLCLMPQCLLSGIVVTGCFPSVLDMLLTEQLLRINLECVLPDHVSEVAFCDLFLLPLPCSPSRTWRAQNDNCRLRCTFSDCPVRASSTVCGSDKRGRLDRFLCPESRWKMTTMTMTTLISATQVKMCLLCLLPFRLVTLVRIVTHLVAVVTFDFAEILFRIAWGLSLGLCLGLGICLGLAPTFSARIRFFALA